MMKNKLIILLILSLLLFSACIKDSDSESPMISEFNLSPENPLENDKVTVTIKVVDSSEIISVKLLFKVGNGETSTIQMHLTDTHDIYTGQIPPQQLNKVVSVYIEAKNKLGKKSYLPEGAPNSTFFYYIGYQPLRMNEIYSKGDATNPDWIELYNNSDTPIDISGYKIYDNGAQSNAKPKLTIPNLTIIPAWGFHVVVTDSNSESGFGLSSTGESVWLENSSGSVIDNVTFPALETSQSYGRNPDGMGNWQITNTITRGTSNIAGEATTTVNLNPLVRLPSVLFESSGIVITSPGKIWSHNDSGNENKLYCFNTSGTLLRTITIDNATNIDWEDLAIDNQKRIYINDAGNNNNNRTDLVIYRIPDPESFAQNTVNAEIIAFTFEDQLQFPPPSSNRHYDIEGIVWHNDSIFMFTKDRSSPLTGYSKIYKIPAVAGTHTAKQAGSIYLGNTTASARVTAADIHPATGKLALLVQQRLIVFSNYTGNNFFSGKKTDYLFATLPGQVEAIAFEDENTILMTEEGSGSKTGYLYRINLPTSRK